jgi:hypothetical protein
MVVHDKVVFLKGGLQSSAAGRTSQLECAYRSMPIDHLLHIPLGISPSGVV